MISGDFKHNRQSVFEDIFKYLTWGIIVTGVLLRIAVFFQCDSMFADEANVARNIFERSYISLTRPLDYYQYAPPVFLWVIKACTSVFGFSEYAYRLFPFICGLLSIVVLNKVLKYYTNYRGAWYVIFLMATGPIYVHYGDATKQYIPDSLISLLLVWLALKNAVKDRSDLSLFLIWTFAGSIAIWSSMPSVFILAGVGCYYLTDIVKSKNYLKFRFLVPTGAIWGLQFAFYYIFILQPQANSDYLQNFHKDYFFYWPANFAILSKDIDLFFSFIATAGGHLVIAMLLHIVCIILAVIYISRRHLSLLLLLVIPILAVLFAASLHQYTLIPRVILFAMPLLLILIGAGLERILSFVPVILNLLIMVVAVINVVNFNALRNFIIPMQQEEAKQSLDFLIARNISGKQLYVEQLGVPAYIYYTSIHPRKDRWKALIGADTLVEWNINFDSLAKTFPKKAAMLYSWDDEWKIGEQQRLIRLNTTLVDSNIVKGSRVYIYSKP